ncbi:oxygen-independent coproporphyrinogen III oxidase, partial [gut metagenome]
MDENAYIRAVLKDLSAWQGRTGERLITSVFVGGGTPSLMSGRALGHLLEEADKLFPFASDCEITLEANPGTVDESRFTAFRKAGVNRLSLGVQSFMDEKLRRLGRIHSASDALRAAETAAEVFENFNLDVMFALPGETLEEIETEVARAVGTGATH